MTLLLTHLEKIMCANREYEKDKRENVHLKRIAELKDELDNKSVHLDLLRKKLVELEEVKAGRSEIRRECEDRESTIKKLHVKIDKQREEIICLKNQIVQLKSNMLDVNCLKVKLTKYSIFN